MPSPESVAELAAYTGDEDDDFDSTYANFYYRVPDEFRKTVEDLGPNAPPSERWQALFAALQAQTPKN